jgi:hypothetical protein
MTYHRRYDPTNRAHVFATLGYKILDARLTVTLDEQLGLRRRWSVWPG